MAFFLNAFKQQKLFYILKSGYWNSAVNYRTIFMLPFLSKIFEELTCANTIIHTIIHFIEIRLQYNWHNNKNGDGLVNRLESNLVITNQAHRVAYG